MHMLVDNCFLFWMLGHTLPWFLFLFIFIFVSSPPPPISHCTWWSFSRQSPFTETIIENKDCAFRLAGSCLNIQRLLKGTDHVFWALGGAGREGQGLSRLFAILFEI